MRERNKEQNRPHWEAEAAKLAAEGLYDPAQEHDACGVGMVAAIDGKPQRRVVTDADGFFENDDPDE